jgi:DNA-binding XRE family transcriptional regulator
MASRANIYPSPRETFPGSLFGRPSRRSYRAAVKQVVLDVKARNGMSSEDLAERIGVSKDTIDNAESETCSMEAVSLFAIAYFFGEEAIEPVRQLYLCAPAEEATVDDHLDEIERRTRMIRAAQDRDG